jgi:hypothetical protein
MIFFVNLIKKKYFYKIKMLNIKNQCLICVKCVIKLLEFTMSS